MSRPNAHRRAFLAGSWYPADPGACRAAVTGLLDEAPSVVGTPRGLIAPHAGWAYSGRTAGLGYAGLQSAHHDADLVVIFGAHRGPDGPDTVFCGEAWDTPFGALSTIPELATSVREDLGLAEEPVRPARPDNAAELHLPFIRVAFPDARLLMLGVSAAPHAGAIGRAIGERVRAAGLDCVFVGSTDLTHYGPGYGFSVRPPTSQTAEPSADEPSADEPSAVAWVRNHNDAGYLDALVRDAPDEALAHALAHQSACCPGAVLAAYEAARAYSGPLAPQLVDHTLSYDIRPSEDFVGYASVLF